MRKTAGILGVAGLLLCFAAISRADPPAAKDKEPGGPKKSLAEDIFDKADKHGHGFLNKYEFKKADADLAAAINQMATDGTIGKGIPSQDASASTSKFVRGFESADTDHDKKVTLAEFTDYANRAIQAADQQLQAQAAAAAAAAAKAAANASGRFGGGRR
jgi:hypothetical protein